MLDQLVEFALGLHLFHLLPHFLIQQVAVQQSLADGLAQRLHGLIAIAYLLLVPRELVFEAALQQMVGKSLHQIFHAQLIGQIGNVFRIADSTHKKRSCFPSPGWAAEKLFYEGVILSAAKDLLFARVKVKQILRPRKPARPQDDTATSFSADSS